jgi:hypothetical protein
MKNFIKSHESSPMGFSGPGATFILRKATWFKMSHRLTFRRHASQTRDNRSSKIKGTCAGDQAQALGIFHF